MSTTRHNMGGHGSGGKNKICECVEDYKSDRLDSFALREYVLNDKYSHLKEYVSYPAINEKIRFYPRTGKTKIHNNCYCEELKMSYVQNISQYEHNWYFICPNCERRVRYLYEVADWFYCRECARLDYKVQQAGKMELLELKMRRIIEKQLGYTNWQFENPEANIWDLSYVPKPRYMAKRKYSDLMEKYFELQDEHNEMALLNEMKFIKEFVRIF